jgi:hypothetical protein
VNADACASLCFNNKQYTNEGGAKVEEEEAAAAAAAAAVEVAVESFRVLIPELVVVVR